MTDQTGEARYPAFKAIMVARKKPVTTWDLTELGVEQQTVGVAGAATAVRSVSPSPPRQAGEIHIDEGDGAGRIADFLVAHKLI